jgi:uncharacterized protein
LLRNSNINPVIQAFLFIETPSVSRFRESRIEAVTLEVLLVVFLATVMRSAFGFGEALIAVPLLAFCMPLTVAAPLGVLLSITIAAIVVLQDWEKIHLQSASWLVISTLPGIPLGLLLLTSSHQLLVKGTLGVILMLFSLYSLMGRAPMELRHESRAWLFACGLCAGILGGAFGMNGPPLVVYGTMRRWPAQQFRATLQAYFLPASIIGMGGYLVAGLWTRNVTHYYLLSLPAAIPAIFLGRFLNHRMRGDVFIRYVYGALAAIGALLLVQAIQGRL